MKIQKILDELNTVKVSLEQTQLDLSNEREARRRLQQQAEESRELAGLQGKRPFVVALIDADADAYVVRLQCKPVLKICLPACLPVSPALPS